jgi:cytochrome c556
MLMKRLVCLWVLGVLSVGHASAADVNAREMVPLPDMMRQQMLGNMRDHLAALDEIQSALGRGEFDRAGEIAEQRIGMISLIAHHAAQMAPYMPEGMRAIGTEMHHAASRFAMTAQEGDLARALEDLSKVTDQCVACHSAYRVR